MAQSAGKEEGGESALLSLTKAAQPFSWETDRLNQMTRIFFFFFAEASAEKLELVKSTSQQVNLGIWKEILVGIVGSLWAHNEKMAAVCHDEVLDVERDMQVWSLSLRVSVCVCTHTYAHM